MPRLTLQEKNLNQGRRIIAAAAILDGNYPRVAKVITKQQINGDGHAFVVICAHEPYFAKAYKMIRAQEKKQHTWTKEDEFEFNHLVNPGKLA
jgi:hypothetical protein